MYNSPFPMTYQPLYYQQQLQQLQSQMPVQQNPAPVQTQNGGMFYFVNSQREVEDWVVGAGQTVFFFDRNNSVFYIKSVAQNGLSQPIEVYDYSQRTPDASQNDRRETFNVDLDNYITRDEFDALKAQVENFNKKSIASKKKEVVDDE